STWKGDRSALLYFFSSTSYLHALILNTNNVGGKDQNRKRLGLKKMTSEKKIKYIPEKDRTKLFNSLRNTSGGYWHDVGVMIFSVMYFTGIRPIEITQSTVINIHNDAGKLVSALRVKNAKNTNGRGNGEFRTIPLDKHNEDFINGIRQFLESASFPRLANGHSTTPENYVKKASEAFGKHIRKIFPKRKNHICLYSARHQFAADAKRSGIRQTEVAALLGHACDRTAYIHYAKSSRSSSTKRIPKALRSEVATVRKKLSKAFLKNKKISTNRPSFPTMGR
ncbi:MAG: tyrosine-type recombinase/integrase, partial [Gammaproteobacteria bacterium]|nr:tyrosine-type recombinase/integrase [Gammaproteobacteria bacterium]